MRTFSLYLTLLGCFALCSDASAQQATSVKRTFETRTFPVTAKEQREFYETTIANDDRLLEEQEKVTKELSDIAVLMREILARQDVGQASARQITPGSAPASMREEISLIRSYLDDMKKQSQQQTKINIMLVKLMREQVGITRALFSGGPENADDDGIVETATPEPAPPLSTLSDRINVRTAPKTNNDTPPEAPSTGGSTWIVR